jgi:hypothetical protein
VVVEGGSGIEDAVRLWVTVSDGNGKW